MGSCKSKNAKKFEAPFENFNYPVTTEKKLEMLETDQSKDQIIHLNVGGKEFTITKNLINSCPYDFYLKTLTNQFSIIDNSQTFSDILKIEKINVEIKDIFIDRSPECFELIIHILRTSILKNCIKGGLANSKFISNKKLHKNDIFLDDLKFYFKKDYENILLDYGIKESENERDLANYIKNFELINISTNNKLDYMFYRTNDIKSLSNKFSTKCFFCNENGELKITLTEKMRISRIDFRPFINDENFGSKEDVKVINIFYKEKSETKLYRTCNVAYDQENIAHLYLKDLYTDEITISMDGCDGRLSISYIKLIQII